MRHKEIQQSYRIQDQYMRINYISLYQQQIILPPPKLKYFHSQQHYKEQTFRNIFKKQDSYQRVQNIQEKLKT